MNNYTTNNALDVTNPAPRCPVVLLLDTSGSMSGTPINELNQGVRQFLEETRNDEAAGMSVELEVVTFADHAMRAIPFTPITRVNTPSPFMAGGMTSMGAALRMATADLKARRDLYRRTGVSSYRPWVVLMTDGGPNDEWWDAAHEMRTMGERGRIQYIGIEIGGQADHRTMCQILPASPGPVRLQGLRFREFFRWLTDSLRSVSRSTPEQENQVMFGDVRSWADLAGLENL